MADALSWRLAEIGKWPVQVKESVKVPEGEEVLIKVLHAGICHSDLHIMAGYLDLGEGEKAFLPPVMIQDRVFGHEAMGVVASLGPDAKGLKIGDHVVVYPWIGCQNCRFCEQNMEHLCIMPRNTGIQLDGGFSTHMLVPHARYCISVGSADPRFACVCACSGLTTFSAIRKFGHVSNDSVVLICGAGGLGFMALNLFKVLHPEHPGPILMDIDDNKLAAATKAGLCSRTINPKTQKKEIAEMQAGSQFLQGVDFAADFVGSGETVDTLVKTMNKGSTLVIVGLFGGSFKIPTTFLPLRQVRIQGSYVGSLEEFRELMDIARRGQVKAMPIEDRSFSELPKALEDLSKGKVMGRLVLRVNSSSNV